MSNTYLCLRTEGGRQSHAPLVKGNGIAIITFVCGRALLSAMVYNGMRRQREPFLGGCGLVEGEEGFPTEDGWIARHLATLGWAKLRGDIS